MLMCLVQVHDCQHHEEIGLQWDHEQVENCPWDVQEGLPISQQSDDQEDDLARKEVAKESQGQRNRLGQKCRQLHDQIKRQRPFAERLKGKLAEETADAFYLHAVEED